MYGKNRSGFLKKRISKQRVNLYRYSSFSQLHPDNCAIHYVQNQYPVTFLSWNICLFIYILSSSDSIIFGGQLLEIGQKFMYTRPTNKVQKAYVDFSSGSQEESSLSQEQGRETKKKRQRLQENSLFCLTKRFINLIKNSQDCIIDLKSAVQILKVPKRRIYDIINVLEGLKYVQKIRKSLVRWVGGIEEPFVERDIDCMRQEITKLTQQQKYLDKNIQQLTSRIHKDYLNEQAKEYLYLTFKDIQNIYKNINQGDTSKTLLIISSPQGSTLQIRQQPQGIKLLNIDSTGKGAINVYRCTATGVRKLQLIDRKE